MNGNGNADENKATVTHCTQDFINFVVPKALDIIGKLTVSLQGDPYKMIT